MNLQDKVLYILKNNPETRNSDITLMIEIWKQFYESYLYFKDGEIYVKANNLYLLPREDNIKRIRAKIQNVDRKFLPTNIEVLIERIKMSRDWKKYLGYAVEWDEKKLEESIKNYLNRPAQTSLI